MKTYKTFLTHRKVIARDTVEISFERPIGFEFKAGQYLQLAISSAHKSDMGDSRIFSIVTSPDDTQKLSVAFRRSMSNFKRSIESMPLNSELVIRGPYGHISLDDGLDRPVVCIAGGIGITPLLSILRYAVDKKLSTPVSLVYANTDIQSAAYLNELQKMCKKNSWLTIHFVYGVLERQIIREIIDENFENNFLIFGPPGMVEQVRTLLCLSGIDDQHVYYEEFVGY